MTTNKEAIEAFKWVKGWINGFYHESEVDIRSKLAVLEAYIESKKVDVEAYEDNDISKVMSLDCQTNNIIRGGLGDGSVIRGGLGSAYMPKENPPECASERQARGRP